MKKCVLLFLSLILALSSIPVYAANESKVTQEMYEDYTYHKQIIDKYIQEGRILPPTTQEYADIDYINPGEKMPRFLAYDNATGQNIPNPNYPQVGDASEYWTRQNITIEEMYKNKEMIRRLGVSDTNAHREYWSSIEGGELQSRIIQAFLKLPIGQEYRAAIETGKQATGKEYRTIEEWLEHYGLFGNATSQGIDLYYTITIGRTSSWYKTYMIPSEWLINEITLLKGPSPRGMGEPIEFIVYHYENGTENEVYREDIINDSTITEVYPKNGKGLDGNEWICTLGNGPQPVTIVDGGEYIFYYTKIDTGTGGGQPTGGGSGDKPTGSETGGELILVKNPLVKANCRIAGRTKIKKNDGGYHPDGMPLFRGDNFKPTGSIKNQNSRDTFTEYSMTLKDKPNKNFRQVNYKKDECIIGVGQTHSDNFLKKIDNNDRYGNVYVLTVEARQRIIVPTPPPKPGPKPTKPSKPDRDDYDSSSEYRSDLADYYDELEDYYDRLEAWEEAVRKWDAYVAEWGNPDTGEVFKYKTYAGRDIWFSEKFPWKNGKGEDLNYVMPNVEKNIEDMDGGLKPGVIIK